MAARKPARPRSAGSRTAKHRASVGRQARQGEHVKHRAPTARSRGRHRGENAYSPSWPRNGSGEWTRRCTGRRSACNKGKGRGGSDSWGPAPGW